MRRIFFLLMLLVSAVLATPAQSQPAIIPDTLVVTLEQGDYGTAVNRDSILTSPLLRALVDATNRFPEAYLVAEYWRSPVRWVPAGQNKRHSNALDGGVNERTEMWLNGVLKEAGLLDKKKVQAIPECCQPEPQIRLSLAWHEIKPKEKPPTPPAPTIINRNRYVTVRKIGGRLRLGLGGSSSPYNGVLTLNLEDQFNHQTSLEATFGHSAGLLSKDREVPGLGERVTDDHLFALRLIKYFPNSPVGLHLGGLRVENVIRDGLHGQERIKCYQGLMIGPSLRFGKNLTAHLSFAYGTNDLFGKDIEWTSRTIGQVTFWPWR